MKQLLLLVALLCIVRCANAQDTTYTKVELFFGLSDHGKAIPDRKFRHFLEEYVIGISPEGLTVTDAHGYWSEKEGSHTRERSKVVTIVCKKNAKIEGRINFVRKRYCELFHQSSVLEVDTRPVFVSF